MLPLSIIILAAGKGTRMRSNLPKVLHQLAGKSMLNHVLSTAKSLMPYECVLVCGHGKAAVEAAIVDETWVKMVEQRELLGTGHAVMQAAPYLNHDGVCLILYGDVPCIPADVLKQLTQRAEHELVILTDILENPYGYGRIVRNSSGTVCAIVEEKDANEHERTIREVNTGILALPTRFLENWLNRLSNDNAQGEYYLTDFVGLAVKDGVTVSTLQIPQSWQASGVNSPTQLAALERQFQHAYADQLLASGVRLADPNRLDVRGHLTCGRDVFIDVNVIFEGEVHLGDGVEIGANCIIRNSRIGERTQVLPFSHLDGAQLGAHNRIGPYARLREGTNIEEHVHIGNFVEIKKSEIKNGSKINHLSYIGDAQIGEKVNIGAGTITCNYDGVNKFVTQIGTGAFIGSGSMLVAPIQIGEWATVGAGSVVSRCVPANMLTVSRAKVEHRADWKRPEKIKLT